MNASATNQLPQVIANLFAESREEGKQASHPLSSGLRVTVSTYPDEYIALSRKGAPPSMDEAAIVARDAGWEWYDTEWQTHKGVQYLIIRTTYPPDDEAEPEPPPTAEDGGPPDDFIRALLAHPGPWRKDAITLRGDLAAYLASARRCQLLDMHEWIKTKFPDEYSKFQHKRLGI